MEIKYNNNYFYSLASQHDNDAPSHYDYTTASTTVVLFCFFFCFLVKFVGKRRVINMGNYII